MKRYVGVVHGELDWRVTVVDEHGARPLTLHVDQAAGHRAHSPTGHAWGYEGSGPAQLAYDLLWDVLGHEPAAPRYQEFKRQIVARWAQDQGWSLTDDDVRRWLATR